VALEAPTSPPAEAFRSLRTAVQFVALEKPLAAIQVTSSKPGEGKTTTAANLAVALAQAGKRVVLLDADLRKPRLHHEFGVPNGKGFTTMLLDATLSAGAFHRTAIPNLVVIPSGPPPPNPSELLSLGATRHVLDTIRAECDVLVIDSPPVLPVTDPLILASRMDGVVLVAHVGQTHKKAIRQAELLLARARARVLGIVFNRVPIRKGQYYSYYYGYGYGGYGAGGEGIGKESTAAGLRIDADLIGYGDGEEEITPRDRGVRSAGAIGADPAHENGGRGSRQSEGYPSGRGNGHSKVRRGDDADLDI